MANAIMGASLTRTFTADQLAQEGKGFGLLDRYTDHVGNEYVFLQAEAAITGEGYVVTYAPDGKAIMTATAQAKTALGAPVAVALAEVAINDFGWFLVKGFGQVRTNASVDANAVLAATTTAGQLNDAVGKTIERLVLTTARGTGAGLAPAVLTYPTVGATTS